MFPQKSDFASAEWFCPLLPLSQDYEINIYTFWSWKHKKQETIGVVKDRTDILFQSWAEQLQNTSLRKRYYSTWMMAMRRHRCGEYRTWASEVISLTLFANQIFFLPPCQIAPSCLTLFSTKNGFAQAGPVLLVWWLPLTYPVDLALWQVPVTP